MCNNLAELNVTEQITDGTETDDYAVEEFSLLRWTTSLYTFVKQHCSSAEHEDRLDAN